MITVGVPVYDTPSTLLDRAVASILTSKTVSRVVVVGDGQTPQVTVEDPRIVIFTLPRNWGRYFADAVVVEACQTPRIAFHDADDYSDPCRLDRLAEFSAQVAYTDRITHPITGPTTVRKARRGPGPTLDVIWGHQALWQTDFVRGLIHPGYRVSWDAVLDNIAYQYAERRRHRPEPYYHICRRPGSLTTAKATGLRTDYRKAVAVHHQTIWDTVSNLPTLDEAKDYLRSTIVSRLADQVTREAERLKEALR